MKIINYYLLFIAILVNSQSIICSTQHEITEAQRTQTTNIIISYFDHMTTKNIIGIEHLQKLLTAPELINPISKEEQVSSTETLTYAKQLETFVQRYKSIVNLATIKTWVIKKIAELLREIETRKRIHDDTKELHASMHFVSLPAKVYVDAYTDKAFEIQERIEFQTTPVTQWQWAQVMAFDEGTDGCISEKQDCSCSNTNQQGTCHHGPIKKGLYCQCGMTSGVPGNNNQGAVWVFVSGTTPTQQDDTLPETASMTGMTEPTNYQGITGASGVTGFSGTTGLSGITGATGVTGITGISGITGATGVTGLTGFGGWGGSPGMSGPTGMAGNYHNSYNGILNPSFFIDGPDSEDVEIYGQKIKLRPDAPVEDVSWNEIQEFLKKLNAQDKEYEYALPSLDEYKAILVEVLGQHWHAQLATMSFCNAQTETCPVTYGTSFTFDEKRIYSIVGNVWQFTRDVTTIKQTAKQVCLWNDGDTIWQSTGDSLTSAQTCKEGILVFGGSYATKRDFTRPNDVLLRQIFYKDSKDKSVGFRLVRRKKNGAPLKISHHDLEVSPQLAALDPDWLWDKPTQALIFQDDGLRWMIDHKKDYSAEVQRTIAAMLDQVKSDGNDAAGALKKIMHLKLSHEQHQIRDLTPLACMKNLKNLLFPQHHVEDISPLTALPYLEFLDITHNPIKDFTPLKTLKYLYALWIDSNQKAQLDAQVKLPGVIIQVF